MFYRELIAKTAKEMRSLGKEGKTAKQQSVLASYREKLIGLAQSITEEEKNTDPFWEAAIIVGSIARDTHNLGSDLDLYLILLGNQLLNKEEKKIDGIEVELFKVGHETILEEVEAGESSMFLIKDGFLVDDSSKGLGKYLIEKAKKLYESGTDKWNEAKIKEKKEEFIVVRQKVKKLLERDEMSSFLILERYTLLAIEAFYKIRGLWQPQDKEIFNDLEGKSPQLAFALKNCLQQWRPSSRFNYWLKLIDLVFEPVGGLPDGKKLRIED